MLDIIILTKSKKDDVIKTLNSLLYQIVDIDFCIYILDYDKKIDYTDIVNDYKKVTNIIELKCDGDINIGIAKQFVLNQLNSKYIMFINSGDVLSFPFAIDTLYSEIKTKKLDMVYSDFFEKDNEGYSLIQDDIYTLNTKIYRKKFLKDNNINFRDSISNISFSFNSLLYLNNAKIGYLDNIISVVKNTLNLSTTIYEIDCFENYVDDIRYLIHNYSNKSHFDKSVIGDLTFKCLYYGYVNSLLYNNVDYRAVLSDILKIYNNNNKISKKKKDNIKIECIKNDEILKLIISSKTNFEEFLKRINC